MKTMIECHIHKKRYGDGFECFHCDMSEYGHVFVGMHTFEYEVPPDFDPVRAEVAMLQKGLENLEREHDVKVANIKEQIQKLLCIENQS